MTDRPVGADRQVIALLARYLRLVVAELDRSGLAVGEVQDPSAAGLDARIRCARAEFDWSPQTGWSVLLGGAKQYLTAELAPPPRMVATFVRSLLEAVPMGQPFPERFRLPGDPLDGLMTDLARHARLDPRASIDGLGLVPFIPEQRWTTAEGGSGTRECLAVLWHR